MKSGVKNKDSRAENSKNLSDILYSIFIYTLTRLTFLSLLSRNLADSMEALALMPLNLLDHKFLVEF